MHDNYRVNIKFLSVTGDSSALSKILDWQQSSCVVLKIL